MDRGIGREGSPRLTGLRWRRRTDDVAWSFEIPAYQPGVRLPVVDDPKDPGKVGVA